LGKSKGRSYNTYIAPQAAYRSYSGASVPQTVYILCSPSPRSRTLTCNQTATLSPDLPFDGLIYRPRGIEG